MELTELKIPEFEYIRIFRTWTHWMIFKKWAP